MAKFDDLTERVNQLRVTRAKEQDELTRRIHNLPAELFNDIRDVVLTPDTEAIHITQVYKPPFEMMVSRATREQFAAKYYGNTTFCLTDGKECMFVEFLASIPLHHRLLIARVHIEHDYRLLQLKDAERMTKVARFKFIEYGACCLGRKGRRILSPNTITSATATTSTRLGKLMSGGTANTTYGGEQARATT